MATTAKGRILARSVVAGSTGFGAIPEKYKTQTLEALEEMVENGALTAEELAELIAE